MRSKNSTSVKDPEQVESESTIPSAPSNNNFNTIQNNENGHSCTMHDKNDTDGSTSLSDWTDSDDGDEDDQSATQSDSEDAIDIELLRGLEEIHINVKPVTQHTNDSHLISKGPQKSHKIRKQGKCQTLPYHQKASSGDFYDVEDRMDLVLSESLNDPGFCNNLLNSLQAQVEQYPKLMTPPLSSTDCAFSDYTSYTSSSSSSLNSNYYQQYTPESLNTDSPQGSDNSVEEETAGNLSSTESINDRKPPHPDRVLGGSIYNAHSGYYQQYTPESIQSSPHGSDTFADDMATPYQTNENTNNHSSNGGVPLAESARRVKSNADNLIDNVFSGIKYFFSSYRNSRQQLEYNVHLEPYTIDEDRANRLKMLAKIIQHKLTCLNEKEGKNKIKWEDQFVERTQMSGGNVYQLNLGAR